MSALLDSLHRIKIGSVEMLVPEATDQLHQLYARGSWYEEDLLRAISERISGGTFVDVGANRGNHSVYFATECKARRVIAIEPYPGEFEILCANIDHNALGGIIQPVQALVHPAWQTATMRSRDGETLPDAWHYSQRPLFSEGGNIKCLALDAFAASRVHVVKIDVEEMAPAVLESGRTLLARWHPLVAVEAEPSELGAVAAILIPLGYRIVGQFCWTPTFLWEW